MDNVLETFNEVAKCASDLEKEPLENISNRIILVSTYLNEGIKSWKADERSILGSRIRGLIQSTKTHLD